METIKFNHTYRKIPLGQGGRPVDTAKLLEVLRVRRADLSCVFIDYDTAYDEHGGGHYTLTDDEYLLLIFSAQVDTRSVFTTLRRYTPEKHAHYLERRGQMFKLCFSISLH